MNVEFYYLLGFINNYSGGFSRESGVYQRISFLDDHFQVCERKAANAERLKELGEKLLDENNRHNDIHLEYWKEGKGVTIYSAHLVMLISNFCESFSSFLVGGGLKMGISIFDDFKGVNLESRAYHQRLQFLFGVVDANGSENEFYFYNDYSKCLLTHYVLKCLAGANDVIELRSYFKTPNSDQIILARNGDIWPLIEGYLR